jgi:hypothetical protein
MLEKLSSVHKDQVFAEPRKPGDAQASPVGPDDDDDKPGLSTLALKAFFLAIAVCLVLSTALGLWMGLTQTPQKRVAWILVVAGTLIPVCLLLL